MREGADLAKTEQPRDLGDMQLAIVEVANRQIAPQPRNISLKFKPSAESLRASVLLLIPRSRATSSASTRPWGSNDEIAFSTLVRNWGKPARLPASAASQYFRSRSLR